MKWILLVSSLVFSFYLLFVIRILPNEVGIYKDEISGLNWIESKPGYHISPPWHLCTMIDIRPMRVGISCACRAYKYELVSFNINNWKEFITREGWSYYWFRNRLSLNFGTEEEYRGFRNIMRG